MLSAFLAAVDISGVPTVNPLLTILAATDIGNAVQVGGGAVSLVALLVAAIDSWRKSNKSSVKEMEARFDREIEGHKGRIAHLEEKLEEAHKRIEDLLIKLAERK